MGHVKTKPTEPAHWLDPIIAEQRAYWGPKVYGMVQEVAEVTENMSPEELDRMEREAARHREEEANRGWNR